MNKLLVSACTVGIPTRYDGNSITVEELHQLLVSDKAIPYCAEVSAGFLTPRAPAEIEYGKTAADVLDGNAKIYENNGKDVTAEFIQGAMNVLSLCQQRGIRVAILRNGSPSCGSTKIYNGKFDGTKISGDGLVTELLRRNGIIVYDHENFPRELIDQLLNES